MARTLTLTQVLALIWKQVDADGSQTKTAERYGCSKVYLSDVLNGKREPGPKILGALKLERIDREPQYRAVD